MPTVKVRKGEAWRQPRLVLPWGGKGQMPHRRKPRGYVSFVAPLTLAIFLVGLWWALTTLRSVEPWVFPTPALFLQRAVALLSDGWIWSRLATTAVEALVGAVIGTGVAIPLAWAIYYSEFVRAGVEPFLGATQAIPAIALAPILVLWLGHGFTPIVVLCALITFFPVLVATTVGLRQMDPDILDAAALDGAGGWRIITQIEAPLAAPNILAGIRNGFALSVTGAVVGEMVMGGEGLGQVLTQQRYNLDTAGMFVTVGLLSTLAMLLYTMIYALERRARREVTARTVSSNKNESGRRNVR